MTSFATAAPRKSLDASRPRRRFLRLGGAAIAVGGGLVLGSLVNAVKAAPIKAAGR